MHRAVAAFATTVLAVSFGAALPAGAETPPVTDECALVVSDALCALVTPLEPTLAPVTDEATVPAPAAPAPAPTPLAPGAETSPTPAPATGPGAATASTPGPASVGGSLGAPSTSRAPERRSTSRVPDVPVGSTLQLGPLALPRFSGSSAAATPSSAAAGAVAERMVLPAARAVAELPSHSRTTPIAIAVGTLLLAGGLLLRQGRRNLQLARI